MIKKNNRRNLKYKREKTKIILAVILLIVFAFGILSFLYYSKNEVKNDSDILGGDRDEHGCLIPAGFSWNETIGACLREWEFNERENLAVKTAVDYIGSKKYLTIVDISESNCEGCFSVLYTDEEYYIKEINLENWKVVETSSGICVDMCGDRICQEIVCQGSECPCTESVGNCPNDCL